jgi:predicted LPLAT superfamily acyltransferase
MSESMNRHWASMQESSFLLGIRVLVAIYYIFGRWAFRLVLYPVVSYYFWIGRGVRVASKDYFKRLQCRFPELNLGCRWGISYRHFLRFGESLLDKIIVWSGAITPADVDFPNRSLMLKLLEQGQGALLLSGHIGNIEICQAIALVRGHVRLNILVHTRHAEKFNRLLGGTVKNATIRLIQVTELNPGIAIELQEKISRGEFVVMVGDRVPVQSDRTVSARFLGEWAAFPQGPYLLASLLKCPIYTLFCYQIGGRYQIDLQPFVESVRLPRDKDQRATLLAELAQRYADQLEQLCKIAPLQWFNFYPYWTIADEAIP